MVSRLFVILLFTSSYHTALQNKIRFIIYSRFHINQNETRLALSTSGKQTYISFYLDSIPDNKTAKSAVSASPFITQGKIDM